MCFGIGSGVLLSLKSFVVVVVAVVAVAVVQILAFALLPLKRILAHSSFWDKVCHFANRQ